MTTINIPLEPSLKMKWVDALRSGKYKQGHTVLRDKNDNYCCLGVLCDISNAKWDSDGLNEYVTRGATIYPNRENIGKAAMNTLEQDYVTGDSVGTHLWRMNDDENISFTQIADWIEHNL